MPNSRIAIIAFAIVIACAQIASAQTPDNAATVAALEQSITAAIARAEPSVVAISRTPPTTPPDENLAADSFDDLRQATKPAPPAVVAAGVIIDPAGIVLTQYLAVQEGATHTVTTHDRKTYAAKILAADSRSGLAVLAIDASANPLRGAENAAPTPGSFPAIRFAKDPTLRKGQFVIAIGNPFAIQTGGEATSSWGTITNISQKAPAGTDFNNAPGPQNDFRTTLQHLGRLVQTDAKLGWNAGGGALVNLQGELVGITTTASVIAGHEQPAGYAIPLNATIRRVIDTLKLGREVEYGMLGIGFGAGIFVGNVQDAANQSPLAATQVYPGTPAARAGLAVGDVITHINNEPVDDVDAVQLAISAFPPGATAKVAYKRGSQEATADVTLAKFVVGGKTIATVRPEAWLGIRVDYATALDATALALAISSGALDDQGCVLVREVEPDSPAWQAGVRPGMFISHVAGKRASTPDEFRAATRDADSIDDAKFTKPLAADGEDAKPDASN